MAVIYETGKPKMRRYAVQIYTLGWWSTIKPGHRTRWGAKVSARSFRSIGYEARVVDTRVEKQIGKGRV